MPPNLAVGLLVGYHGELKVNLFHFYKDYIGIILHEKGLKVTNSTSRLGLVRLFRPGAKLSNQTNCSVALLEVPFNRSHRRLICNLMAPPPLISRDF